MMMKMAVIMMIVPMNSRHYVNVVQLVKVFHNDVHHLLPFITIVTIIIFFVIIIVMRNTII